MEDISVLGEAEPGVVLRRQLLQDPPGDRPGVAGGRAEFRQHHVTPGNHRVEDRHVYREGERERGPAPGWRSEEGISTRRGRRFHRGICREENKRERAGRDL